MKSLADGLPPEIAQQIHPDWRKNEAAYWAVRDRFLGQYQGQWIGFADGAVIVAASTPLEVFLAVQQSGRHPFVIRVGYEKEPWYRIRRASFTYDTAYPSAALPVLSAEFRAARGSQVRFSIASSPTQGPIQRHCRGRTAIHFTSIQPSVCPA